MAWLSNLPSERVEAAQRGDAAALSELLNQLKDPIFGLSIRMLADPEDAADATQEILLRVTNHLGSFRAESGFGTWAYRVAANHLLTLRAQHRDAKAHATTFEEAALQLDGALAASAGRSSEDRLLIEEVKLFCTHGMLMCLDRGHRLAYILGEILELGSDDAAAILEITSDAFRQRLSRARSSLEVFVRNKCGLVNRSCGCRCAKLVPPSVDLGLIDPQRLRFATHPRAVQLRDEIDEFATAAELFRSQPQYGAPEPFARSMRRVLAERLG